MSDYIYRICYKGQTEPSGTWFENSWISAEGTMEELQEQYPDREWYIYEMDVS